MTKIITQSSLARTFGVESKYPIRHGWLPTGEISDCQSWAQYIANRLPGQVTIYVSTEVPGYDEHVFAVVDNRYLVDPHRSLFQGETAQTVYDLITEASIVKSIYGSRKDWRAVNPKVETRVPVPVRRIEKKREAEAPLPQRRPEELPDDWYRRSVPRRWTANPEGFSDTKTGMPYYDQLLKLPDYYLRNKGVVGRVVMMTPDEYLAKVARMYNTPQEREEAMVDRKRAQTYADMIKAGTAFDMPMIDYAYGKRGSQEGRHRAVAAKLAGIKQIPVLVVEEARPSDFAGKDMDNPLKYGRIHNPNKVTRWAKKRVKQAGGLEKVIGYFLIGEGAVSIVASQDQRTISTVGRVARILAGVWLVRRRK